MGKYEHRTAAAAAATGGYGAEEVGDDITYETLGEGRDVEVTEEFGV